MPPAARRASCSKLHFLALVALLAAAPAVADEMIVFKQASRYAGTAIQVSSWERRGDKLLLKTAGGDLFTVPESSVDWAASKRSTELLRTTSASQQARAAEEEAAAARVQQKLASDGAPLSLVEASRRYGVSNPGLSVSTGAAPPPPATPARAGAEPAKPPGASPPVDQAAARKAKANLDRAAAGRDALAKQVSELEADNNPDPLWAAKRASKLEQKRSDLEKAEALVKDLTKALEEATKPPSAPPGP